MCDNFEFCDEVASDELVYLLVRPSPIDGKPVKQSICMCPSAIPKTNYWKSSNIANRLGPRGEILKPCSWHSGKNKPPQRNLAEENFELDYTTRKKNELRREAQLCHLDPPPKSGIWTQSYECFDTCWIEEETRLASMVEAYTKAMKNYDILSKIVAVAYKQHEIFSDQLTKVNKLRAARDAVRKEHAQLSKGVDSANPLYVTLKSVMEREEESLKNYTNQVTRYYNDKTQLHLYKDEYDQQYKKVSEWDGDVEQLSDAKERLAILKKKYDNAISEATNTYGSLKTYVNTRTSEQQISYERARDAFSNWVNKQSVTQAKIVESAKLLHAAELNFTETEATVKSAFSLTYYLIRKAINTINDIINVNPRNTFTVTISGRNYVPISQVVSELNLLLLFYEKIEPSSDVLDCLYKKEDAKQQLEEECKSAIKVVSKSTTLPALHRQRDGTITQDDADTVRTVINIDFCRGVNSSTVQKEEVIQDTMNYVIDSDVYADYNYDSDDDHSYFAARITNQKKTKRNDRCALKGLPPRVRK